MRVKPKVLTSPEECSCIKNHVWSYCINLMKYSSKFAKIIGLNYVTNYSSYVAGCFQSLFVFQGQSLYKSHLRNSNRKI